MKQSKYYNTMCAILDAQFPKGKCKERGQALVMLSYIEMMLRGIEINICQSGHVMMGMGGETCPECEEEWIK